MSSEPSRSRWSPLWALLGFALPISFARQLEPALYQLRPLELLPLYATEWLLLAFLGVALVAGVALCEEVVTRARRSGRPGRVAEAAFILVVVTTVVLGALSLWSEYGPVPGVAARRTLLVVAYLLAAMAYRRWPRFRPYDEIAGAARAMGLLGLLTVASLALLPANPLRIPAVSAAALASAGSRPNVVLITIDTLSAQHMSLYGAPRATTPRLDAFAHTAVVFDAFRSNGNFTTAGISSILTGTRPWTHRALHDWGRPLASTLPASLPARLHEAGYRTAYFASNPLAGARRLGLAAAFDVQSPEVPWAGESCLDAVSLAAPYWCHATRNAVLERLLAAVARVAAWSGAGDNPARDLQSFVARAQSWLASERGRPIFLWIHLLPPHDPYAPPPPWLQSFDRSPAATTADSSTAVYFYAAATVDPDRRATLAARYEESIAYTDHYLGALLDAVRASLGPHTAVIITADHGESFAHDYGGHGGPALYDEVLRIPLVISVPWAAELRGRRSDGAEQIDIAPTIAAIAGIDASAGWEGRSLLASSSGAAVTTYSMSFDQSRAYATLGTGSVAAVTGRWKLVRYLGRPRYPYMPALEPQLFDLAADPGETRNLAPAVPDVARELSTQIDRELALHGAALRE